MKTLHLAILKFLIDEYINIVSKDKFFTKMSLILAGMASCILFWASLYIVPTGDMFWGNLFFGGLLSMALGGLVSCMYSIFIISENLTYKVFIKCIEKYGLEVYDTPDANEWVTIRKLGDLYISFTKFSANTDDWYVSYGYSLSKKKSYGDTFHYTPYFKNDTTNANCVLSKDVVIKMMDIMTKQTLTVIPTPGINLTK